MENFDIAIIGGGPAGSTLARLLEGRFRTAIIDSGRSKPCGGLLSPDAQKAFAEFDLTLPKDILVDPQIFSVRTIDLRAGLERHYQRFYMNLDRAKFDRWLLSLVPDNVVHISGLCKEISRGNDGYRILYRDDSMEHNIYANVIVGADGASSIVRKFLYPGKKIRRYTAIQQWFPEEHPNPFYSCIFDPETTDCCSWSISKDSRFIYGGAFPAERCRDSFERQKARLAEYGFRFGEPLRTEACTVLRPSSPVDICTGRDNAYLIGEAAGFISPSSLEGISFAVRSARLLAEALNSGGSYSKSVLPLRVKIAGKVMKCPFMYRPALRRMVMKSGLASIPVTKRKEL